MSDVKLGRFIHEKSEMPEEGEIYIYGAGQMGELLADFIRENFPTLQLVSFLDDMPSVPQKNNLKVEAVKDKIESIRRNPHAVLIVAIQNNENAMRFLEKELGSPYYIVSLKFQKELERMAQSRCSLPKIQPFSDNCFEPPVQLAISDLCSYGDVVYDVGANIGGIALGMSKVVGPRGVVCAFEASPRVIRGLFENIRTNFACNVQVYHKAVCDESGKSVKIYYAHSHFCDTMVKASPVWDYASSIALDDFAGQTGLYPAMVKMDIEGAEILALKGMKKLLKEAKPHLIMEQKRFQKDCFGLLTEAGYIALDTDDYSILEDSSAYDAKGLMNILFIHKDKFPATPYSNIRLVHHATLDASCFEPSADGQEKHLKDKLKLPPGRYCFKVVTACSSPDSELNFGLRTTRETKVSYVCSSGFLNNSYSAWPVDIEKDAEADVFVRTQKGWMTFAYEKVDIFRVSGLNRPGKCYL